MSSDGFTLAETLAALLIVGLSIGGLTKGAETIGQFEKRSAGTVRAVNDRRSLDGHLDTLFHETGPFLSDGTGSLIGKSTEIRFPCGSQLCSATLSSDQAGSETMTTTQSGGNTTKDRTELHDAHGAHFRYHTASGDYDHWPFVHVENGVPHIEPLLGVSVVANDESAPIANARIWHETLAVCAFDTISNQCRKAAP